MILPLIIIGVVIVSVILIFIFSLAALELKKDNKAATRKGVIYSIFISILMALILFFTESAIYVSEQFSGIKSIFDDLFSIITVVFLLVFIGFAVFFSFFVKGSSNTVPAKLTAKPEKSSKKKQI